MPTANSFNLIGTNASFASLAISSVALRFWIRRLRSIAVQRDDYLMCAAMLFSVALAATNIIGVPLGGFGEPITTLDEATRATFSKLLFAHQFLYLIAVALVKLSVLAFYARLFTTDNLPLTIKITTCITTTWLAAFLLATLFQIWPVSCNWTDCPDVNSRRHRAIHACASTTDVALDVAIMCIPVLFVRKVRLGRAQKLGLLSVFGLGVFCIVASIVRLIYAIGVLELETPSIPTHDSGRDSAITNMITWSGIEASASIICANLPTYGPYLRSPKKSNITAPPCAPPPSTKSASASAAANTQYYNSRWPSLAAPRVQSSVYEAPRGWSSYEPWREGSVQSVPWTEWGKEEERKESVWTVSWVGCRDLESSDDGEGEWGIPTARTYTP